jgi:hypothetical protein
MQKHPTFIHSKEAESRTENDLKSRLEDVGDIGWCTVFVLVSLAGTSWLWWTVISILSPR